jgi:hypothetical protein
VRHGFDDGCLNRTIFVFDQVSLVIGCDPEDDSVELRTVPSANVEVLGSIDATESQPWKFLLGKPFGWGWITVNQQGYCDGVLLTFNGIQPQLLLTVGASAVSVSAINRV